jgi:hypothetical protein
MVYFLSFIHGCRNRWGDGSSVGALREFISQVQVQVLFKRILRGWSYKVEGAFGGEKWEYFVVH